MYLANIKRLEVAHATLHYHFKIDFERAFESKITFESV